jgi:hypothetical protein
LIIKSIFMKALFLGLLASIVFAIFKYFYVKRQNRAAFENDNKLYRNELRKYIREREEILVNDILEIEEGEFWNILEKYQKRAKGSYKNQLGLIKDYLLEKDEPFILGFYITYLNLINKNSNFRLIAAFQIIVTSVEFSDYHNFISWLVTRGQVLFYNSVNNPEIICNIEIKDIVGDNLENVIMDCYGLKFDKMFPTIIDLNFPEIEGDEIPMERIPDEFPLLWNKFIRIPE